MLNNRHIGRFSLDIDLINRQTSDVLRIMDGMIVVKADYDPCSNKIEYMAICPKYFRGVAHGEIAPQYVFELTDDTVVAREL